MSYDMLVRQMQQAASTDGDEAFGALIDQFWESAVRWAMAVLGDLDQAEDAAQEAFIQAYRQIADLREPTAFPAWLRRPRCCQKVSL